MQIPSYFINLDEAVGRRQHMESEANRIGFELSRIPGVKGSALPREELERWSPSEEGRRGLTPGEIGCFLSHRRAWQAVVDGGHAFGAIFEDDVHLSEGAKDLLRDCAWVPQGAELIKLETFLRKVLLRPPFISVPEGRILGRLGYRHYGTGGYIVSGACARKLLGATESFFVPVDLAIFSPESMVLKRLDVWQLSPAICVQQMQSRQQLRSDGIEESSLQDARMAHKAMTSPGFHAFAKQAGQSIENAFRELRKRSRVLCHGDRWNVVEFR